MVLASRISAEKPKLCQRRAFDWLALMRLGVRAGTEGRHPKMCCDSPSLIEDGKGERSNAKNIQIAENKIELCPMTDVLKVLGPFHHLCSYRIQMYVSHQFAEIAIRLAENRLVAALKEVPDLFVLTIVVLAKAG